MPRRGRIGKSKVSKTMKGVMGSGSDNLFSRSAAEGGRASGLRRRSSRERVVVFTRYPEAGKTKTRLIPRLGPEGAASLQRAMTEHVIQQVRELRKDRTISVEVRYKGGNLELMSRWLGLDMLYRKQSGQDLGARMLTAFQEAFDQGEESVLLIGTDCPDITGEILEKGFQELLKSDLVFGPAADGGYYLVGMKRSYPLLFSGILWGTASVLDQTVEKAGIQRLSVAFVARLQDVDRPEDLDVLQKENSAYASLFEGISREHFASPLERESQELPSDTKSGAHEQAGRERAGGNELISVIIPTLNEERNLLATLENLAQTEQVEIIVADGGSTDRTRELAKNCGAIVVQAPPGRATQMNAAVGSATGDILLFLHADTRLPNNWIEGVRRELAKPGTAAGAFALGIDSAERSLRAIENLANFRSRRFQLPYGDQAIFVRSELFRRIGGYADLPIMEDVELIRRLRRYGRIRTARERVLTSPRRWERLGVVRTTAINQIVIVGYVLGIAPTYLARLYCR